MTHWSERLPGDACREAVEWARTQPDYETAWATCVRGDWMLWLVGQFDVSAPMSPERRRIVRCVVEIVETVRHLMPPDGIACLDLVSRWCEGVEVSKAEMRAAAAAAAAYAAAAANAVAYATYSAAYSANAVAYAAYSAAYSANAVAYAAYSAAYSANAAVIVRRHYPTPPVLP